MAKDYYDILGVPRGASTDQIKKAYRAMARKYHPDTAGNDPAAADRFKELQKAYDVLKDPKKRQAYDRFGQAAENMGAGGAGEPFPGGFGRSGRTYTWTPRGQDQGGGFDFGDISDIFGGLGGGGEGVFEHFRRGQGAQRTRPAQRGEDIEHTVRVSFDEAINGTTRDVVLSIGQPDGSQSHQRLSVKIPAGVETGSKIRLRGKGQPGMGGENGDLIIAIEVESHRFFEREGNDIILEVPISISEAALGTKIDVPTLSGKTTVTIPPGSSSHQKLRLKGKGVRSYKTGKTGDMYLVLRIVVPKPLDDESQKLLKEFAGKNPQDDLRKTLW